MDWSEDELTGARLHLQGALAILRVLPPYASDDKSTMPEVVQHACLQAFYMNARLVADFFVKRPARDVSADDFYPAWQPPQDLAERLTAVWELASKWIAHMSEVRVAMPQEAPSDSSLVGLEQVTADCHKMVFAFTNAWGPALTLAEAPIDDRSQFFGLSGFILSPEARRFLDWRAPA